MTRRTQWLSLSGGGVVVVIGLIELFSEGKGILLILGLLIVAFTLSNMMRNRQKEK
jgi:hypothetical protein